MKQILLTQNKVALVDDEDFERVNRYNWNITSHNYAETRKNKKLIRMHRFILDIINPKIKVDHINGNGLDNRKENLRICHHFENIQNQKKRIDNISGFKGVSWSRQSRKWLVQITYNKKKMTVGYFHDKIQAAHAYNEAAIKYHGEFARLNKI